MSKGWRSDCQSRSDVRSMEAAGLRPLRRRLAGRRQCTVSDLKTTQALQSHRGRRTLLWIPRQEAQTLRRLLLQE